MPNPLPLVRRLTLLCLVALAPVTEAAPPSDAAVLAAPDPAELRQVHKILAAEPHIAGSPGDARTIERLVGLFESFGLEVERHEFFAYLPKPVDAALSIATPDTLDLPLHEPAIHTDPMTGHPGLDRFGWNAYSGNGDVTAPVVYANYGRLEDFERLNELGVSCEGAIVLARYGGNFRGYKAKYAQDAGAVGLVIFTDPDDNGYTKGSMYPEGGFATPKQIQRGSIKTLAYDGDPLTPFIEATLDADRLDPANVGLPTIPVQPVGWAGVEPILARMKGPEAPEEWRGGMAPTYRLTGGEGLTVRLMVEQSASIVRTANVIATLRGADNPEQKIIIGSHHDAWGFGAGDPLSGTIVTVETARALTALMEESDWRPARSVVFACWGAEEFGIIGSVEWCEANAANLLANAVAYINLDAAAMGPNFHAGASPTLQPLIRELAGVVPDTEGNPIHGEDAEEPMRVGRMGGGSDHVGFLSHLCIPSINLGAHGAPGSAYHSNYDTIAWYRQIVGMDYEPARMLSRMTALLAVRLADSALAPIDPSGFGQDAAEAISSLRVRAEELSVDADFSAMEAAVRAHHDRARDIVDRLARSDGLIGHVTLDEVNALLISTDRAWFDAEGLPGRPWHRNLYAAPDETSGYAAWAFPGIRHALEAKDLAAIEREMQRCVRSLGVMTRTLDSIDAILPRD